MNAFKLGQRHAFLHVMQRGKPCRFYVNGRRVRPALFRFLSDHSALDCFSTVIKSGKVYHRKDGRYTS